MKLEWKRLGTGAPEARWGHVCVTLNSGNQFLVFGGNGNKAYNDIHLYNSLTNGWSKVEATTQGGASTPQPRYGHSATLFSSSTALASLGGGGSNSHYILLYGGKHNNSKPFSDIQILQFVVNPSTGLPDRFKWLKNIHQKSPDGGRAGHTAISYHDKLYVFGGHNSSKNKYYSSIVIFNLETLTWDQPTCEGSIPPSRGSHSTFHVGNQMYIFGGFDGKKYYNDLYCLDLDKLIWKKLEAKGTPPKPRSGHSSTLLGDKLILFGGCGSDSNFLNDIHILNLEDLKWEQPVITGMENPYPRFRHTANAMGHNKVFIYAGTGSGALLSDALAIEASHISSSSLQLPQQLQQQQQQSSTQQQQLQPSSSPPTNTNINTNNNNTGAVEDLQPPTTTTTTTTSTTTTTTSTTTTTMANTNNTNNTPSTSSTSTSSTPPTGHSRNPSSSNTISPPIIITTPIPSPLETTHSLNTTHSNQNVNHIVDNIVSKEKEKKSKLIKPVLNNLKMGGDKILSLFDKENEIKTLRDNLAQENAQRLLADIKIEKEMTEKKKAEDQLHSERNKRTNLENQIKTEQKNRQSLEERIQKLTVQNQQLSDQVINLKKEPKEEGGIWKVKYNRLSGTEMSNIKTLDECDELEAIHLEALEKLRHRRTNIRKEMEKEWRQDMEKKIRDLNELVGKQVSQDQHREVITQLENTRIEMNQINVRYQQLQGKNLEGLDIGQLSHLEDIHHNSLKQLSSMKQVQFMKQLETLKKEKEQLQDQNNCVVCTEYPPNIVLLPCRHNSICSKCCKSLTRCPICRSAIDDKIETYI